MKTEHLLIADKARRSESLGADSPLNRKDGAGICRSGLHQPDAAGHLRHEGSRPRFSNGDDLAN